MRPKGPSEGRAPSKYGGFNFSAFTAGVFFISRSNGATTTEKSTCTHGSRKEDATKRDLWVEDGGSRPGLEQTIDLQTILPMAVKWENEEEGGNGGKAHYITDLVSDRAVELCKKAVPTGEETGSKKNKAKARSFTVPELQRTVEQLNAKLVEFTAAQVELPKAKSKMRKQDLVLQLEGEVRLAYNAALYW
jgi:hypothetical protein